MAIRTPPAVHPGTQPAGSAAERSVHAADLSENEGDRRLAVPVCSPQKGSRVLSNRLHDPQPGLIDSDFVEHKVVREQSFNWGKPGEEPGSSGKKTVPLVRSCLL